MRCCVTGGAGFIGSNLAEALVARGWNVTVLDDLSTGKRENLATCIETGRLELIVGSVGDRDVCRSACEGADYVFHEAALCSVPLSVKEPERTHAVNAGGTLNVFLAARDAGVKRVVWASSTAVYGDSAELPNRETMPLRPLSPYAASKAAGEMYASAFSRTYGLSVIGLRYFNVFGRRQDPFSAYSAVIPLFVAALLRGERPEIFGDGGQTRDFVHVDDVVQANIRAALHADETASGRVFNIGCGERITINELYRIIAGELGSWLKPIHREPRAGDVRDSVADIGEAREAFGYEPSLDMREGLKRSLAWYKDNQ
jgi:nucleoside-diphosphate-sugar epimerase